MSDSRSLRETIKAVCPQPVLAAARAIRKALFPGRLRAKRFEDIYRTNAWRDESSVSGSGSNLAQTETLRAELPGMLARFQVRSMLDAPCGDLFWISKVDLPLDVYIGADIVPELIASNQEKFARQGWSFQLADITRDDLPCVDVILCRDCLVHLSFKEAVAAVRNMQRSGSKYLLTTHFTNRASNRDIETGDWRPLNLRAAPFNFPEPCAIIDEKCTELGGQYSDKCLAMWRLADIQLQPAPSGR